MKFSTIFTTAFSVFSIVQAQQLTPVSDPLSLDIAGRDLEGLYRIQERDLVDVVESLVSNINVTGILDSIDFESIAGWVDTILNNNNNVQYLDDLLNFVADTDLVPFLISWIISNNSTRAIAGEVTIDLLGIAGKFDLTPVFVALKDSGLAYTLIADLIENPHTFPFVKQVVIDLLSGSGSDSGDVAATTSAIFATTATTAFTFGSATGTSTAIVIDTDIQFSGGAALTVPGTAGQSTTSIGSINTASLANLFSEAAAENTDPDSGFAGTATATATIATTVATTASVRVTLVSAQATAVASGDSYLGITGPAFQSVPTSQFDAGPTSINYSALAQITAAFGSGSSKKRDELYVEERDDAVAKVLKQMRKKKREIRDPVAEILEEIRKREVENAEVEEAIKKVKRDNIQNLLTTIFSSVARSDILNETIDYLVTDQRFEDSVVLILRGVFSNLGSTLTGALSFDWSSLAPLVRALFSSGLITDTITRAFNDPDLGPALWSDITLLFKRDLALREEVLAAINGTDFTSLQASEFISTLSISTTVAANSADTSTTPEVSVIQSAAGFSLGTSVYTSFIAMLTVLAMML